jgi:hypothetical protein
VRRIAQSSRLAVSFLNRPMERASRKLRGLDAAACRRFINDEVAIVECLNAE